MDVESVSCDGQLTRLKVDPSGFGEALDSYIGCKVKGANNLSYTFQKIIYEEGFTHGTECTATYRLNESHIGGLSDLHNGSRTTRQLNVDSAETSQNKLVSGDYILGAVLVGVDGRSQDNKSGQVSAGLVPITQAALSTANNSMYGIFPSSGDSAVVRAYSVGASVSASANMVAYSCVHTEGLNICNPPKYTPGVAGLNDLATPALTLTYSGVKQVDSSSIRVRLIVYALVGPRPVGSIVTSSSYVSMETLAKATCNNVVTFSYGDSA